MTTGSLGRDGAGPWLVAHNEPVVSHRLVARATVLPLAVIVTSMTWVRLPGLTTAAVATSSAIGTPVHISTVNRAHESVPISPACSLCGPARQPGDWAAVEDPVIPGTAAVVRRCHHQRAVGPIRPEGEKGSTVIEADAWSGTGQNLLAQVGFRLPKSLKVSPMLVVTEASSLRPSARAEALACRSATVHRPSVAMMSSLSSDHPP